MATFNDAMVWIENNELIKRVAWSKHMICYSIVAINGKIYALLKNIEDAYLLSEADQLANDWIKAR